MRTTFEPLQVTSLKEACITRLEELILSGELKAGERLPAERDFAARLGVSRPVLHEALVDLAAKGLVTIHPRRGVLVNDFRVSGSCAILSSLLTYHNGSLDVDFTESLLAMRVLVETETARLAALYVTPQQERSLEEIIANEAACDRADPLTRTSLDFDFHLAVAIASGNLVYPLILNSFKKVYTRFTGVFFSHSAGSAVMDEVLAFHRRLVSAIREHQPEVAAAVMRELLLHGEQILNEVL